MTQKIVAEIFVETLISAGVKRIYGVVGDSLNGLLEEIRKNKSIEWIGVRHEETAAFAAGAQAHVTAVGFNLWALKAVLSGRGDEVIDLAVSNLIR